VRAVFLDRDGVLNAALVGAEGTPLPPRRIEDVVVLPGVPEACAALRAAGFRLVGCTNQPDIARGATDAAFVARVNALVCTAAGLDEMRLCPHDDADDCACRKPRPGMLLDAAREAGVALARSWMVGDRWRDVEAGQAAGCRTVLVGPGHAERGPRRPPDARAADLAAAARLIVTEG
jgi:D-glycero-D-manno-heptose 1,7-bisphosphate phosphatase